MIHCGNNDIVIVFEAKFEEFAKKAETSRTGMEKKSKGGP